VKKVKKKIEKKQMDEMKKICVYKKNDENP
jgi:hypothetical protein